MHLASWIGDLERMAPAIWTGLCSAWVRFAQGAGATLITSVWQGAAIVFGLEIVLRTMPRMSAAHRFAVWSAGFAVALGLPLLPLLDLGDGAVPTSVATGTPARALLQIDARWGLAIAGLWVVASAVRGADLLMHSIRLRRLWKAAKPVPVNENLVAALKNVRGGRVAICTTEKLDRPSVIGFFAPRILIPEWLLDRLTAGELQQIVLHEAEHLRRHDDWTNLVQKLALVVFPLNPALAWMEHRLCREREMACDEGVVRITNAPRAYAACLASLAERGLERRTEALSLGAWHKRSELAHRVHGILLRKRGMSRMAAGALLAAVGCALLAATVGMARAPELVAFVPEQRALAMTPARQQQMAALLAQESADSKIALPPGYQALPTGAVLPPAHHASPTKAARHAGSRTAMTSAGQTRSAETLQQMAKGDAAGDRVNAGAGQQQWIVLSAWEEVRTITPASSSGEIADYDGAATQGNGNTIKAGGQERSQAGTSYTVTQLILRVVPASPASNSTQPAGTVVRGGWFVIQL